MKKEIALITLLEDVFRRKAKPDSMKRSHSGKEESLEVILGEHTLVFQVSVHNETKGTFYLAPTNPNHKKKGHGG